MAQTQLRGTQVLDGSVQRSDLNVTTAGQAVIRKVLPTNSSIAITSTGADSGTGDVSLAVANRYFSVKDYGAIGDGTTDDIIPINLARTALVVNGGGVLYFPRGNYRVSTGIDLTNNMTILGDGDSSQIISTSTSFNTVINHIGSAGTVISNVNILNIALKGNWLTANAEGGASGLITATYVDNITISNCFLSYSCFMGMLLNHCTNVKVLDNTIKYCPRDLIAVWNSTNTIVDSNILLGNDDDGISLHSTGDVPVRSNVIVSNNTLTDTGGIRTISMYGMVIKDNTISRPKGYGIACLNSNPGFTGLLSSSSLNNIHDNTITDVIDRQYFIDGTASNDNLRTYILFDTIKAQAGALSSIPGTPNTSGIVSDPYGYYQTNSGAAGTDAVRPATTNKIHNNICKRTLPSVANYSVWGFGTAFKKTGFIDLAVTEAHLNGQGIALRLPQENLVVAENIIDVGNTGIIVQLATGVTAADCLAKNVFIKDNNIRNVKLAGINISPGTLSHQDIVVENNKIDCDPYFTCAARGANIKNIFSKGMCL